MHHNILFELGIVLFLGFFSAVLLKKLRQSVITGYMVTGLIIGPNMLGLVKDTTFINTLSELGVVLLMFFLGLEFSIKKFKKVRNSVLFIGSFEIIANFVVGYLIGVSIGLVFSEKLFLAGILTLSSSGVVAKLLFDMKRTAAKESEVLMGVMVYEDFIAVALLGVLTSIVTYNSLQVHMIAFSIGKSLLFYSAFIFLGILFINIFTDKILMRIESQELFTALIMGIILLVSAFAVKVGLASAAGAFLLGMLINNYDVEERLHRTVSAFKDIFLIIFFISFGMLLNPKEIPGILWMVAIIVPISILVEVLSTSTAALFSGFSPNNAISMGTSMIARGEYSMIYVTLGYGMGVISDSLYQFTGVYVFIMTLLAPIIMKHSPHVKSALSKVVPNFMKYNIKLISVTMKPIMIPEETGISFERSLKFILVFILYVLIVISAFLIQTIYLLIPLCLFGLLVVSHLRNLFKLRIKKTEEQINYYKVHQGPFSRDVIIKTVADIFAAFLAIVVLGASFWNFGHMILIALLLLFVGFLLSISIFVYKSSGVVK